MAIAKMLKLKGVVLKKDYPQLIQYINSQGVLEFSQVPQRETYHTIDSEPEMLLRKAEEVINYINPQKQRGLIDSFIEKPEVNEDSFENIEKEFKFEFIYTYFKDLTTEEDVLKKDISNIISNLQILEPIKKFNISLQDLTDSKFFTYRIGYFKSKDWKNFNLTYENEKEKFSSLIFTTISEFHENVYVVFAHDKRDKETVSTFLENAGFKSLDFSNFYNYYSSPFSEIYNLMGEKKLEKEKKLKEIEDEKKNILGYFPKLCIYYDYLKNQVERKEALEKMGGTKICLFFEGWIKSRDYENFKKGFLEIFPHGYLEVFNPKPDDSPPVSLENPAWLKPYEVITMFFGLPSYWGIDPTPILAVPFTIFFAINMGDAGYALMLFLFSIFMYRKYSLNPGALKALKLAFYLSVATFVVGIATWSWWGYSLGLKEGGKIFGIFPIIDPWESVGLMKSIVLVLALGIVSQYWAIINRFWFNLKKGDSQSAWLDQGVWLLLITSLLLYAASSFLPQLVAFKKVFTNLLLLSLILTIFTQGRSSKNLFGRIMLGIISLYGFMGYYGLASFLQDVLSYSRLIALNLTSSGVAKALNNIVDLFANGIGWVIVPVAWILFHLFNLVMGLLGAFIHAFRLQAIELFGRFYEGGGASFKPLGFNTSYVKIIQKNSSKEEL